MAKKTDIINEYEAAAVALRHLYSVCSAIPI
ncbi:hypothetical protein IL54_1594 [Sphingobium sp. ba1]|nr:hypothetical protein IL54_1594 [Sphingobium sp. ba1]